MPAGYHPVELRLQASNYSPECHSGLMPGSTRCGSRSGPGGDLAVDTGYWADDPSVSLDADSMAL